MGSDACWHSPKPIGKPVSQGLVDYADQMKDGAAVLQHRVDALSNETITQLEKYSLKKSTRFYCSTAQDGVQMYPKGCYQ